MVPSAVEMCPIHLFVLSYPCMRKFRLSAWVPVCYLGDETLVIGTLYPVKECVGCLLFELEHGTASE